jgi:hypothetical protein
MGAEDGRLWMGSGERWVSGGGETRQGSCTGGEEGSWGFTVGKRTGDEIGQRLKSVSAGDGSLPTPRIEADFVVSREQGN